MNPRTLVILGFLVLFLALTAYVLVAVGYVGFFREALSSPATILMATDLTISLGLVLVWMRSDAKASGVPFAPYLIVTLAFGVAGPLGYLLHRELRVRRALTERSVVAV